MPISERKESAIRNKKKKIINAINKAIESLINKGERGETYRDEDLRFLRNVFKDLKALEESIADEGKQEQLPEGSLRIFVEQEWQLNKICKDREQVVEATGYYRCEVCQELHEKGRDCMYDEYKKNNKNNEDNKDNELNGDNEDEV